MTIGKFNLVGLDGKEFEITMCPPNRNAKLKLNKLAQTEMEAQQKLAKSKKYKVILENHDKLGNLTDKELLGFLDANIGSLSMEFVADKEALEDDYLIERVKSIINPQQPLSQEQWELIKSAPNSEFWGSQDLGVLNEALSFFRTSFRIRQQ